MFTGYRVDCIVVESKTIKSFYFKSINGLPTHLFIPGQYVNVKIQPPGEDKNLIRSYTLSDSPGKDYLRLTIKREPGGKSSNYFHDTVAVGDVIQMSEPIGNFTLDTVNTDPVVFLSGGVGITPMLSMAEYILENQPEREVHFIHSSRNKEVQPMFQRLHQMKASGKNFHLTILHSSPVDDEVQHTDYHLKGHVTRTSIPSEHVRTKYYICGPDEYIKTVRSFLSDLGITDDREFFEYFVNKIKAESVNVSETNSTHGYKIRLLASNKEVMWDKSKGTLLELCESIGLTPTNSCRMGTCATCESRLVKGTYEYNPEPFMEPAENNIFICCAIPTSDIEIEL